MRVRLHPLSLLALLLSLAGCQLSAHTKQRSVSSTRIPLPCLQGTVITRSGKPVRRARVTLSILADAQWTDSKGRFQFCHAREKTDADNGSTRKIPLPQSRWKVTVFHKDKGKRAVWVDFRKARSRKVVLKLRRDMAFPDVKLVKGGKKAKKPEHTCRFAP